MPNYALAKTTSLGQLFVGCGTREVAGSVSNIGAGAGNDATIVYSYNWSIVTNRDVSGKNSTSVFCLVLSVPAYQPIISSVLNVMDTDDKIEELNLNSISRSPNLGSNKILGEYVFKDGYIDAVNANVNSDDKNQGEITITFNFNSLQHNNNVTNTSGEYDQAKS